MDISSILGEESSISLASSVNWLNKFDRNPVVDVPGLANRCARAFGLNCGEPLPDWKGTARATLEISEFTASLRYRYICEVTSARVTRGLLYDRDLAVPVITP